MSYLLAYVAEDLAPRLGFASSKFNPSKQHVGIIRALGIQEPVVKLFDCPWIVLIYRPEWRWPQNTILLSGRKSSISESFRWIVNTSWRPGLEEFWSMPETKTDENLPFKAKSVKTSSALDISHRLAALAMAAEWHVNGIWSIVRRITMVVSHAIWPTAVIIAVFCRRCFSLAIFFPRSSVSWVLSPVTLGTGVVSRISISSFFQELFSILKVLPPIRSNLHPLVGHL